MEQYGARVYTSRAVDPQYRLDSVPPKWALRLDLDYKTGAQVVLIYPEGQPPTQQEEMELMLKLQIAAGQGRFVLYRSDADVTRMVCPPLSPRARP